FAKRFGSRTTFRPLCRRRRKAPTCRQTGASSVTVTRMRCARALRKRPTTGGRSARVRRLARPVPAGAPPLLATAADGAVAAAAGEGREPPVVVDGGAVAGVERAGVVGVGAGAFG